MLDMIFIVDDLEAWHEANVKMYPEDYSNLKYLGPKRLAKITRAASGLYYNQYLPMTFHGKGLELKYWVISKEDYINDSLKWNKWMYVAGRGQKPFEALVWNNEIANAVLENRRSAIRASLLLILWNEHFTDEQLFTTAFWLSYIWDKRMDSWLESSDKVSKIVIWNIERIRRDYNLILKELEDDWSITINWSSISVIKDGDKIDEIFNNLPEVIRNNFANLLANNFSYEKASDVLSQSIRENNKSTWQSVKSALTAWKRFVKYGLEKWEKALKSSGWKDLWFSQLMENGYFSHFLVRNLQIARRFNISEKSNGFIISWIIIWLLLTTFWERLLWDIRFPKYAFKDLSFVARQVYKLSKKLFVKKKKGDWDNISYSAIGGSI